MPVYVQHEVLSNISDVFNAQAIWQAPGLALFSRRPLLRDLLERCPREQRGKAAVRCFSHISLALPQDEVDDDRHLTRGARARDLADTLRALHEKDFGDLLHGDEVRYHVVGDDTLENGAIDVKFGHAVYVPAAGEKVLYQVSASRDSAIWKPVCQVHADQRLVLVGNEGEGVSHAVPGWPFGDEGAVLIINDGPNSPAEVQVRPRQSLLCDYDAVADCYTLARRGEQGKAQRLLLKVTRVTAARTETQDQAAGWKNRESPPAPAATALPAAASATAGADLTYAPVARQRVSLAALALPRLSRYRETGVAGMTVSFDRQLGIADAGAAGAIGFALTGADEMFAVTADGRQRIEAPASFTPFDERELALELPPAELAERYIALVRLPDAPAAPLAIGVRLTFGRAVPTLARLRVLDSPRFLACADGIETGSADRIGLSRCAFSFEVDGAGVRITRQSERQALFHLDPSLRFVALVAGGPSDPPYLLPGGHHLVAGHYVLRFDA